MRPPPENCPICGADVPRNARACPECGADESTGWSEEAETHHLDLPDDNFDYDEFTKREFGGESKVKPHGMRWLWWIIAFALVIGLIALMLWR